ncbi:hypothetical protein ACIA5C_01055 [Actinoplanes sp. NPDC051343]|uniref:hypothetical protein n=1 Tax=Actinoplanes sp. NPDC051343 TaxID=3363906 RepID=UPI003797D732
MFDLDDLPPSRPLPVAVRVTARRRLHDALTPSPRRRRGSTVLAVVAAAAVVLMIPVAGAVVDVPSRHGSDGKPSDGDSSGTHFVTPYERYGVQDGATTDTADRCRRAEPSLSRPEPASWRPALTASSRGDTVVVFRSGATVRFCELTPQTVAVSTPASIPAAGGSVTYVSAHGTVAGVVDRAVEDVSVADPALLNPTTTDGEEAVVSDGVFVLPNTVTASPASLHLRLGAGGTRPATTIEVTAAELPAAVTSVTDRRQPAADRSTVAGHTIDRCAEQGGNPPLVDAPAWEPAASARLNDNESIQLARYGGLLAVCVLRGAAGAAGSPEVTVDDGLLSNGLRDDEAQGNPSVYTHTVFYGFANQADGSTASDTVAVTGLVLDGRVASVSLSRPRRTAVVAGVVNGTFILPAIGLNEGGTDPAYDRSVLTLRNSAGGSIGTAYLNL